MKYRRKFGKCKKCGKEKRIQAKKMCCYCYNKTHYGLEYFKERLRERRITHLKEIQKYCKEYREKNREHLNKYHREWVKRTGFR